MLLMEIALGNIFYNLKCTCIWAQEFQSQEIQICPYYVQRYIYKYIWKHCLKQQNN